MYASARQRTLSALAAFLVVAGGMLALASGFAVRAPLSAVPHALKTIVTTRDIPPEPEPPRPQPKEPDTSAAKGDPSPPNLKNEATPVFAPVPRLPPLIEPPPVVAAPKPGAGTAASTGASDRAGSGQGAGGSGEGSGAGGSGYGSGRGFERPATLPRQTRGRLHFSDLPQDLRRTREGAELTLRYLIGIDGRVSNCRIVVSSGRPELDAHTCAYITDRFRFRPALDTQRRPVPYTMTEIHGWDEVG